MKLKGGPSKQQGTPPRRLPTRMKVLVSIPWMMRGGEEMSWLQRVQR